MKLRIITFILIFLTSFTGCSQKNLTLKDLIEAKWDSLTRGVYYISKEGDKDIALKSDSFELTLKGSTGKEVNPTDSSFNKITGETNILLSRLFKLHQLESKAGYLRINLNEMMGEFPIKIIIYLRKEYDTLSGHVFRSDSIVLKNMTGIKEVNYISKEAAKQKYIADGNEDWANILSENPLPATIELNLDDRKWTEELLNKLKNSILDQVLMVSEIYIPDYLFKKSDEYFFVEYKRK